MDCAQCQSVNPIHEKVPGYGFMGSHRLNSPLIISPALYAALLLSLADQSLNSYIFSTTLGKSGKHNMPRVYPTERSRNN